MFVMRERLYAHPVYMPKLLRGKTELNDTVKVKVK